MNLRWKAFEQSLRPQVAKHDARRQMTRWQRFCHWNCSALHLPLWPFRAGLSMTLAAFIVLHAESVYEHVNLWMGGMGLWGLLVTTSRAGCIQSSGAADTEYRTLWMLPLSPDRIFQSRLRQLTGASFWLGFEFLILYQLLITGSHSALFAWTNAALCAVLQTILSLTLTFWLVALRDRTAGIVFLPLLFTGWLYFIIATLSPDRFGLVFAHALEIINPFGWINRFYSQSCIRGEPITWWPVPMLLGIFTTLPAVIRSVRRMHHDGEFRRLPNRLPRGLFGPKESPPADSERQRQHILNGAFLRPMNWENSGLVERLIARLLTPRERTVAEILRKSGTPLSSAIPASWTKSFLDFVFYFFLFLLANGLIQSITQDHALFLITEHGPGLGTLVVAFLTSLITFAIMIMKIMELFFTRGALEQSASSSQSRPNRTHSQQSFQLLPLNHWEIARIVAKVNSFLLLLLLPLAIMSSFAPLWQILNPGSDIRLAVLPKLVILGWSASILVACLPLTPSVFSDLRYWRSVLIKLLTFSSVFALGIGFAVAHTPVQIGLFGTSLIVATVALLFHSGYRHRQGLIF